jgi:hypothetical protein
MSELTPAEMIQKGIQALDDGENRSLSYEAAAHTAMAWAALAEASVRVREVEERQ